MIINFLKKRINNPSILDLLHNSIIYLVGNGLIAALAFFGSSILTRFIPPEDYAIISLLESYKSIFICLVTFNTYTALGRYLYEDTDDKKVFFGTLFIFSFSLILLFQGITIFFLDFFSDLYDLPTRATLLIAPMLLIFLLSSLYEQFFIPKRKSKKIIIRKVIYHYLSFGLSLYLAQRFLDEKYLGYLYGLIGAGFIFGLVYFIELYKYIEFKFNFKHLNYMLSYSLPLLPYTLSGVILAQFDKIMINNITGKLDTGLYSFASNVGMIIPLLNSSFALAWMPSYYKFMEEKDSKSLVNEFSIILRLLFLASVGLLFFGKEVITILSPTKYHGAVDALPSIIFSFFIYIIFTYYSWIFSFLKRNSFLSMIVLCGGIINIYLNSVFIPIYGYIAAAYTTIVSYVIMLMSSYFLTRYYFKSFYFPMNVNLLYIIFFLFLGLAFPLINELFEERLLIFYSIKILLLSLVILLCYLEYKFSIIIRNYKVL
ncbi:MAG: oligosaccharide flippase family protein [Leptospira sp.]|nr:oligosaccharide flippase family protein [Leptospira sp.]